MSVDHSLIAKELLDNSPDAIIALSALTHAVADDLRQTDGKRAVEFIIETWNALACLE